MERDFKVGDYVIVTAYTSDLGWPKGNIGSCGVIEDITEEGNYSLAEGFIYSAEELKLIKPPKISKERFPYFNPPVEDPEELTQAELQFLTKLLSINLAVLENRKLTNNLVINNLWETCDKDDSSIRGNFKTMNRYKDSNRKVKAKLKKLSVIQAKLKKQAGK